MSSSERPTSSSLTTKVVSREMDPLLKDLGEQKQIFRRNVVSLAAELKDVRHRLASQEQSFVRETLTRQEAEAKAKKLEEEIIRLQESIEERNGQLQASASESEKYLKELDDLHLQLRLTQSSAEANAVSAQSAQLQYSTLLEELDMKNLTLKEQESRVTKLAEQLDLLQKDLKSREIYQKQLKDEVVRVEHDIMQAVAKAGISKDSELIKLLDEESPRNIEMMNKLLSSKDEEMSKLRDEITIMSAHWKFKIKELESQLEKQRRVDQELKKKVLRLELCLQDARSQTRKLQRMGERRNGALEELLEQRDVALKELREQLAALKQQNVSVNKEKQKIFETSGFKIVVSMSMLALVLFSKR